jgi:hypothetical protein
MEKITLEYSHILMITFSNPIIKSNLQYCKYDSNLLIPQDVQNTRLKIVIKRNNTLLTFEIIGRWCSQCRIIYLQKQEYDQSSLNAKKLINFKLSLKSKKSLSEPAKPAQKKQLLTKKGFVIHTPTKAPVHTPTKAPVHTPTKAPVHTPIKAPVHTPIKAPVTLSIEKNSEARKIIIPKPKKPETLKKPVSGKTQKAIKPNPKKSLLKLGMDKIIFTMKDDKNLLVTCEKKDVKITWGYAAADCVFYYNHTTGIPITNSKSIFAQASTFSIPIIKSTPVRFDLPLKNIIPGPNKPLPVKASLTHTSHSIVPGRQIAIITNKFKCSVHHHELESIIAEIPVKKLFEGLGTLEVPAGFCKTCSQYYILSSIYDEMLKEYEEDGCLLSRFKCVDGSIVGPNLYSTTDTWSNQSPLRICGYSVSLESGLSEQRRRLILDFIIDQKILSREEVKSYLNFFITKSSKLKSMVCAIEKWKSDLLYISKYKGIKKVFLGV